MGNVAIIFWSGTGNTEAMADYIAQGVRAKGGSADVVEAGKFAASEVGNYEAFALGCPAMGDEGLEDDEFLPLYEAIEPLLAGHKAVLFGSYNWGRGKWMEKWEQRAEEAGIIVAASITANDYPDDEISADCVRAGEMLAS